MGLLTDSRLTYLNGVGYNVIRLPRDGIEPLHALGCDLKAGTIGGLSGLGVSTPGVDVAYERERSVQFEFNNVRGVRVEPLGLSEYLADGDLESQQPFASYFAQDSRLHRHRGAQVKCRGGDRQGRVGHNDRGGGELAAQGATPTSCGTLATCWISADP